MAMATTSSSYPPPPPYYRLYKVYLQDPNSAPAPPPLIDGAYHLFGATYTTDVVLPSLEDRECVSSIPKALILYGDLRRFFLSAFYHMGESHLFYNMTSLLWKGIQLETSVGCLEFASMVAALLGLSQCMTLLVAKSLLLFFEYETPYYNQYSVGFSGVLFAMKVVLNSQADDYTYVHGMIGPSGHSAWAELILIQLFVPGVSLLGHLGGILVGLRFRSSYSGPDPIAALIGSVAGVVSWPLKFVRRLLRFGSQRISGRGTVGGGAPYEACIQCLEMFSVYF